MSTISSLLSKGAELTKLMTTARRDREQTMSRYKPITIYMLGLTGEISTVFLLEYFLVLVPLQLILLSKKTLPESNDRLAVTLSIVAYHLSRVTWLMS